MTIPSRPAPPPPTSATIQQSQNGGVIRNSNNNNNTIKILPPPGAKKFPLNHNTKQNNYSSISEITAATNASSSSYNSTTKSITRHFPTAKTRYAPSTNWNGSAFDLMSNQEYNNSSNCATTISSGIVGGNKRMPPPRPPPPRLHPNDSTNANGLLKKPGPPQSVNVLSNLFGRRNKPNNNNLSKKPISQILPKNTSQLYNSNENNTTYQSTLSTNNSTNFFETSFSSTTSSSWKNNDVQLISFDSPPSSPTFTQKSNSDCVSVDSFSSDSNFSSPNNGSVSQPESGFEDDFIARTTSPPDPWETIHKSQFVNNNTSNNYNGIGFGNNRTNYMSINELSSGTTIAHPVRNINVVNKIQTENHLCNGKSLLPPNPTLSMPTIIRPNKGLAPKPPITIPKPNLSHKFVSQYQQQKCSNTVFEDDPPMPKCPPPPPPPSDIGFNDEYVTQEAYGIALYAFDGAEDGDLCFRENDKIYLIGKLNDEWFMGRTKSGCEGIFPSNYIDIKVPLKDNEEYNKESQKQPTNTSSDEILKENKIKVLFNFEAEQEEDLTIYENDVVNVLYKINEDWLFGKIHNRCGQFPANFIEYVPPDLPLKMP